MTWLARLSLRNRAIVALVTIALVVFGVVSTTSLRQELFPSLDVPVASVATQYVGASAATVADQVTTPIEKAVGNLTGVTGTSSTSSSGSSVVTLSLDYGTDQDTFRSQLQRALDGVKLPTDVTPQIVTGGLDNLPVVQLAVSSNLGPDRIGEVLRDEVQPYLQGLAGVSSVGLTGLAQDQVVIDVDPAAAAARGVAVASIGQVLQANGVRIPAGQLTPDTNPLTVEVGSPITSLDDVRNLYVGGPGTGATGRGGAPVRLGDIATVTSQPAPATGYTRTNGQPSIGISVVKLPDANTVSVSDEVRNDLGRITDALGGAAQNAQATVVFDQAPFITQSVESLTTEGLLGLAFAVLVILLFLLSVRATLVTAVSIPLSVLIAMIVLYLGGYTLNILTLGALTVAVGRVVDDSIVVIENIKRHVGARRPTARRVVEAVREVAGAITASTLTTVAVFAPIGLVGGQVGQLFRPFAVTVSAALLASLVVSLTVVPVLASVVLRSREAPVDPAPDSESDPASAATDATPEKTTRLQRGYLPILTGALRRPVLSLGIAVLILAGTVALVPRLTTNFLGDTGGNTVSVTQELPAGTGLPAADAAAKRVEGVVEGTPGVASYQVTVGSTGGGLGRAGPAGGTSPTRFSITLADGADATTVQDDLRTRIAGLGGTDQIGEITVSGGQGGLGSGNLQVSVRADDPQVLADAAGQVQQAVAGIAGVTDVRNDLAADQPAIDVRVDRQKAAATGLTESQVGQAVTAALRGSSAGQVTIDGVAQDVVVRTGQAPADAGQLRALTLPTARGPVPLSDLATVMETTTRPTVTHTDGVQAATITARPTGDDVGAASRDLRTVVDGLRLPSGATAEIGGVSTQQSDAFRQLFLALLAAVAAVYLVMVATFRSLVQPLLLLVSVPFAATGAIGLLLLTGTPLGVPALIGMLMLVGIVVTNAIVLIDLVNQRRRAGLGVREAVVEGAVQRLRPIIMTAVATICALVPMSLGLTGGGVFISQPLAVVVIGGLISSTLLTLVLVPVLYLLVERARGRRRAVPGDDLQDEDAGAPPAVAGPDDPETDTETNTDTNADTDTDRAGIPVVVPAQSGNGRRPAHARETWTVGAPLTSAPPSSSVPSTSVPSSSAPAVSAPRHAAGPVVASVVERRPVPAPPTDAPGVHGTVRDADGVPLPGATVSVFDPTGQQIGLTIADGRGEFALALPPMAEYLVVVHGGGREPVATWARGFRRSTWHDVTVG
ncbi:efflux RND transporter permease subunit [Pseudonocardia sp. RS11V-5]|uniref:efflux RND transporter permease subunit n=1 Tax=Pseudonocardia terrae TaxID=2905831 RepID=UPI001E4E505F|nr:efflux RND transporter permease subunit [Pseudonocardia terrae]MCE3554655.1 efflux RND transporter permease subunit [Pseudonocardia terrae]